MSQVDTSTPGQLFHQLFAALAGDIVTSGHGLLSTFFTNVIANPTAPNVLAQGAILAASAPMQLPNLESDSIAQIAKVGQQLNDLAQQEVTAAVTPIPPAAEVAATAVPPAA